LEPTFALAYAGLGDTHGLMYWFYYDRSKERLDMAWESANKALQLDPDLPEARIALGGYYSSQWDFDRALKEYGIARKSRPNNSMLLANIGYAQERLGEFEQAAINIGRACELDPRSHLLAIELALNALFLPDYPKAEHCLNRAISLTPDSAMAYDMKALLYMIWKGDTKEARAVLEEALQNIKSTESASIVSTLIYIDIIEENYQEALDALDKLPPESRDDGDVYSFTPYALRRALIYGYMNEKESDQTSYESACNILESMIKEYPEDARVHAALGMAYAGLGRKKDAIQKGSSAVELLPLSKDAIGGVFQVARLASIYVMVGEFDKAIDQLEFLRSKSKALSIHWLRLSPEWVPLRNHPRFKKLLEEEE